MWVQLAAAFGVFLVLSIGYSYVRQYISAQDETVPLSQIAQDITAGTITSLDVSGDKITATYADKTTKTSRKETESSLTQTLSDYGIAPEKMAVVKIEIKDEGGVRFWALTLLPILVPIMFLFGVIWYLSRQLRGGAGGMQAFSFGKSMARLVNPEDEVQKVTFKDVAGAKEAKSELLEIVDFLKNPKKFIQIGARIPKGVLLMGAPGTGKTLLARAVAGEAGVPFFSISGSEFVEMFVGVGASRVRDLFLTAKKAAPSIVFIDEIDAVGRVRGTGVGGGNDEREQTLNQILVEMDGFEPNEKVIVMAASNRPDVLDPALLRPGRFDRRVMIDLPDRKDREEILRVHARSKPLGADVKLVVIAERTPGFSGADLASLMNEGAILAAREDRKEITQYDLIRSIEKVMLGPERRSHVLNKKEKEITAYHEAGHALVASVLPYADPVHKISIISRGRAAGYTLKLPFEDRRMQSRKEFLDDIAVSLGGFIAEKMVFDDVTTGASNDLQVLSALARNMVARYGMSDKMGPIAFAASAQRAIFGEGVENDQSSQEVAAEIDAEVKKIILAAHKKAEGVLTKHRAALDAIAQKLVEVETLERAEFENILIAHGITPKKKEDIEHAPLA
ncbi:cell division protein FtsH [Candidatus Kaiserbacteria bacterium RIFCSPHIGHO2_02_FULL_55_20]|uniref:ATP-dependent zinc metalloprotease FtsH n=1 Tax=Candidatus Kaiserbacteria bacterium RIFCSPHIGHO2_02_FULL_55_20 TaxID=1798497 RepID=A0A1F6DXJ5_9BACT|nr:MAG: cell division protein FtsH [Candidatus Kaiserbacteria bacterium RIFCSPHIGHO2_01_FULL_55_37]OGG66000.1 MAG: cell division protein FtsH [Candidatus Kaiserbacteria bacterium RIFCSPHIGHO2_02_FULL_55_20]